MKKHENIVGIIPARAGSRRVPGKNIRMFAGKPLLAWTVEEARKSKYLDRVIVSTEDEKTARIAKRYGAEVPFMRPNALAKSSTFTEPVLRHAIEWLKKNENYKTDIMVLLYTTNPLRSYRHIDEAIELFLKKRPDSLSSACEMGDAHHHPQWVFRPVRKGGHTELVNAVGDNIQDAPLMSQYLSKYYVKNDIVYVFRPKVLYQKNPCFWGGKRQEAYYMDSFYDEDINTQEDWDRVEKKFKVFKKIGKVKARLRR
ncbi:MAG: hypothetical protein A3K06_01060 [Candidatus Doudnabacteria bacterium RIFCSPHIGHO2_01_52_17]|uniref:Pseudaminic acid cytidylyltransferase n=1 Tax=Candidatus Doudnabacteria bacterium RIFCSPHIGHO2_01_52_17 TaxID=1817820 RepID=A0A1F5NE55_9BACT|nr:MAG: CMP-N-acetylneuraminic acid synthetase [Parcubacteria group bacterium GW2011_GWA2_52_8]OGE75949.1 MAG: hypothetical protein A3K06_01060 [Candidatus Doudnabacteria bacterium RIFCSPHIGHO2_01_52_17]